MGTYIGIVKNRLGPPFSWATEVGCGAGGGLKICTVCGAKWRGEPTVCPFDGGTLDPLPDPLIGRTFAGRYVIGAKVGTGGMGVVYRARHEVAGRDVAIKFLAPELARDATNRRRFLREAKAANRIDHEHIIDITDYGETDDGLVYLVMEFLEGEPLSQVIAGGPLGVDRAVAIASQIAAALARAHELDVVHRDIKPDNVFVLRAADGSDFVKLLDFGLAKMKGEMRLTASGTVFGTPEYMPPEQARGLPLSGRADLYGLGCVLYELLVGEPPFSGRAPEVILKHMRDAPVPPSARVRGVPAALDAVVLRLLEKEPSRRHADGHHLLEELRAVADAVPGAKTGATIREANFAALVRPPADNAAAVGSPSGPSVESWQRRLAHLDELARRAHPEGMPPWLRQRLDELARLVAELAQSRGALEQSASRTSEQEDEIRHLRLRLGRAIDVLGRDESRVQRELAEIAEREEHARRAHEAQDGPLRAAWSELPSQPGAGRSIAEADARAILEAGRIAEQWIAAHAAWTEIRSQLERRERERDDLRFQIAHLKGRLATLSAEGDFDLAASRERNVALEAQVRQLIDRIGSAAASVVAHLSEFPALRDAVLATDRGAA